MRQLSFLAILFAMSSLNAQYIRRTNPTEVPPSWRSFAPDSWILVENSHTVPGKPVSRSKQKTVYQKNQQTPFTLYRSQDGFKTPSPTFPGGGKPMAELGFKKTKSAEEDIAIQGKKYKATVTTWQSKNQRGEITVTLWEVPELKLTTRSLGMPGPDLLLNEHVVKAKLDYSSNRIKQSYALTVVNLKKEATIAGKTVSCLKETLAGTMTRGGTTSKATGEVWTSSDVPGGLVKLITSIEFSKDSPKMSGLAMIDKQVLVDFEAKKSEATSTKKPAVNAETAK